MRTFPCISRLPLAADGHTVTGYRMKTAPRTVNWKYLPGPLNAAAVKFELIKWSTDQRTSAAIARQAALMGLSETTYLHRLIAAGLASNEGDSIITYDGRILTAGDGYGPDGLTQNV